MEKTWVLGFSFHFPIKTVGPVAHSMLSEFVLENPHCNLKKLESMKNDASAQKHVGP